LVNLVPWGGGYRTAVAWSTAIYTPRDTRAGPALARLPRDETDVIGETALYTQGLSEVLFLGAWHLGRLPPWVVQVAVSVNLINDGPVAWPSGASLCHTGGNFTAPGFHYVCVDGNGRTASSCASVLSNQRASLLLAVPLQAIRDLADHSSREVRLALCGPTREKPFGVLLRVLIFPENPVVAA